MHQYLFSASLSSEQCEAYYKGLIKYVVVTSDNGERIQLQFRHFRRYIDALGFRGRFRLTVTEQGAFVALEKIN